MFEESKRRCAVGIARDRREREAVAMAVIQQNDGTWGYCPEQARGIIEKCIVYSDEPGYPSAADARAAIARDKSVKAGAITEYLNPEANRKIEPGAASFTISLSEGRIEVRHGTDGTVLAALANAPAGTWGAIWALLKARGFEGPGITD